jgi:predicted transcriptional regulator
MKKDKMNNKTFKVDDELWAEITKTAKNLKTSKGAIIRIAVIQYINKIKKTFKEEYDRDLKEYLERDE